jgi:putative membrane protein insertion efficiency factor
MGHRDSPTQFSRHSEFFGHHRRAAELGPARISGSSQGVAESPRSWSAWALLALLEVYKSLLAPFFGGACKYYPSCSNYAYQAIARYGARRGTVLALRRLFRCRPFSPGGFDPVPTPEELSSIRLEPRGMESLR